MTITSEYGGRVGWQSSELGEDLPIDTRHVRDSVINNAAHMYDQSGQVRVMWASAGEVMEAAQSESPATRAVHIHTFGPFPLTVRSDGTSAPLVVRVAGEAVESDTATFYVGLFPERVALRTIQTGVPNVSFVGGIGSGIQWHDPSPDFVQLDEELLLEGTRRHASLHSDGGAVEDVTVVFAQLEVWASAAIGQTNAKLYGVYAREYIGG